MNRIATSRRLAALAMGVAAALVTGCQQPGATYSPPDAAPTDLVVPPTPDLAHPGPWTDFPSEPVLDTSAGDVPANAPSMFGVAGEPSGGPCVVEPELGTVMPLNWIRPRVRFTPAPGQNLFEIRFHTEREANDLVVYTSSTTWTMSAGLWRSLSSHIAGDPITVTVRGASWDGQRLTSPPRATVPTSFSIAPVAVSVSIVYSSASANTSVLRGADVTAETSRVVLTPAAAGTQCIGCHTATPDAVNIGFVQSQDASAGTRPSLGIRSSDGRASEPTYLTAAARLLLATPGQDSISFARSHYLTVGDRVALSSRQVGDRSELVWTDLAAASIERGTGWDVISRDGDQHADVATPVFSHDGTFVLYASGTRDTRMAGLNPGGSVGLVDGDLLYVQFSSRLGGTASSVPGATGSRWNEYAPSLSPDDRFVAYARVPNGESSQSNIHAEIAVVPLAGGAPARLQANEAPTCLGSVSSGVGNSWPRFAPDVARVGSTTWYWMVFSSKRGPGQLAQVYVSAVLVDESQQPPVIKSTPALYVWSQPANLANHTPTWEALHLSTE